MSYPFSSKRSWRQSSSRVFILSFASAGLAFGLALATAPQKADDPKAAKDTTDKPPKPKPIREEEEETSKAKIKKPLRVDEDDLDGKSRKSAKVGLDQPADLAELAKDAKQRAIRDLYKSLAQVRDVVTLKAGSTLHVAPIAQYVGSAPDAGKTLEVQPYDDGGKRLPVRTLQLKEVTAVRPYEEIALTQVDSLLGKKEMPRQEMLRAAEEVLATVLRYHLGAREKKIRKGDAWNDLEKRLRTKLLAVQQDLLVEYANANNWDESMAVASRLAEATKDQEPRAKASQQLARIIAESLKEENWGRARRRKKTLEQLFPGSAAVIPIDKELEEKARAKMDKAKAEKDPTQAMRWVREAQEIWPGLPGLKELGLSLTNAYPVLRVGVPELPKDLKNLNLSPATAFSDTEKQAVELIFDSLIKPFEDPAFGQRYFPGLAVGRPKIIPGGRQFQLAPDAQWSDGTPVTDEHVIRTVQLLRDRNWAGFSPEWSELVENPLPSGDSHVVNLTFRQGLMDPLAYLTFKVLPPTLEKPDDAKFAKNPVGCGPFMFEKGADGEVLFLANSHYRQEKPPPIQEIHFFHSDDPARDFAAGRLHLLLDLPTERIQKLQGLKEVRIETLRNRRVYFLAVNYRHPPLRNEKLRRALAHAINRTKILDDVFRADLKGDSNPPHRPLNGPYPLGSWPCKSTLPADPYDPQLAKVEATQLKQDVTRVKLSLKYPDGDNRVEKACKMIQDQVAALDSDFQLVLEPRPARQLRDEVELGHEFQLAYYHYDYPSPAYSAWPLFDPNAMDRGGSNYLGYQDTQLAGLFIRALGHREFDEVRKRTHDIHSLLYEKMPLIPLWQLDTHIAVHEDLTTVRVDPLLIFSAVEGWKLEKK